MDNRSISIIIFILSAMVLRSVAIYSDYKNKPVKKREVVISLIVFILSNIASLVLAARLIEVDYFKTITIIAMCCSVLSTTVDVVWIMIAHRQKAQVTINYFRFRPSIAFLWGIAILYQLYELVVIS